MNNEIKEIREYISCPQFGDNHYGKWGALRLEQRKKIKDLLDCITNLQEEYKKADYDRHKLFEQKEKAYGYLDKFIPNEYGVLLTERQWNYAKELLKGAE